MLGKISRDDYFKYFSYFSQQIYFNISCKLSPWRQFAWNVKVYFLGKYINLSSAELDKRMVKVKLTYTILKISLYEIVTMLRTYVLLLQCSL